VTGIERITLQLFSPTALSPLDVVPISAGRMKQMLLRQTFYLPACLARTPSSVLLCPGFPPTPLLQLFRDRVIPYVHDVFLLSRRDDLNWRAKAYSAWPFDLAVRRLRRFLVNTADTATKLRRYCREDADITVYRPPAENRFKLSVGDRADRPASPTGIRLVALATVEPRKNLVAGARIVQALHEQGFVDTTLEVIGRRGWGEDWDTLRRMPGVTLHGYRSDEEVRQILESADALICTSHEEGLGLPLLEAQFAGLPIIAPDQPVFREVLGYSGIYIDQYAPGAAAEKIAAMFTANGWRAAFATRGGVNLRRWNKTAASDHDRVVEMLSELDTQSAHPVRRLHFADVSRAHGQH
jgi:glycosyltransferase involved in cell wall biosynthesis